MLNDVLAALHELPTPLSSTFFSDSNMQVIQQSLIAEIKSRMGITITNQDREQVIIVMKYVYRNTPNNQYVDVPRQVAYLNSEALKILRDLCITGLKQYLTYIRDASSLPQPLPLPKMTSVTGTRLYGTSAVGADASGTFVPNNPRATPQALAW